MSNQLGSVVQQYFAAYQTVLPSLNSLEPEIKAADFVRSVAADSPLGPTLLEVLRGSHVVSGRTNYWNQADLEKASPYGGLLELLPLDLEKARVHLWIISGKLFVLDPNHKRTFLPLEDLELSFHHFENIPRVKQTETGWFTLEVDGNENLKKCESDDGLNRELARYNLGLDLEPVAIETLPTEKKLDLKRKLSGWRIFGLRNSKNDHNYFEAQFEKWIGSHSKDTRDEFLFYNTILNGGLLTGGWYQELFNSFEKETVVIEERDRKFHESMKRVLRFHTPHEFSNMSRRNRAHSRLLGFSK